MGNSGMGVSTLCHLDIFVVIFVPISPHDVCLSYRLRCKWVFDKSLENQSAAFRISSVKPKSVLFEIGLQVHIAHSTLMRTEYPSFQQTRKPMYPRHMNMSKVIWIGNIFDFSSIAVLDNFIVSTPAMQPQAKSSKGFVFYRRLYLR